MKRALTLPGLALLAGLAACSDGPTSPDSQLVTLESLSPANGSVVSTTTVVTVGFSRAMMQGMETMILLHEGSVTGPVVSGVAAWSPDRRTMTFTPAAALHGGTTYVLHLAPGLRAADGYGVNQASCAGFGGQRVEAGMMGSGGAGPGMMGPGWQMAGGGYGMIFTFTTN